MILKCQLIAYTILGEKEKPKPEQTIKNSSIELIYKCNKNRSIELI